MLKHTFKNIPINLASGKNIKDTKYTTNPSIVAASITGPASIFDIQNVNDIVLKEYAITGIIIKFAESVMLKDSMMYFIILFDFLFNFPFKKFEILSFNITIPIVPANDSKNPKSVT